MAASNSTLTSLWVDDATASTVNVTAAGTQIVRPRNGGGEIKEEVLQFYRGSGLELVAKEVGVLDTHGQLVGSTAQQTATSYEVIHVTPVASSPARQYIPVTTQYVATASNPVFRQVTVKAEPGTQAASGGTVTRHITLPPGTTAIKTEGGAKLIRLASPQASIAPRPNQHTTYIQASPQILHKPAGPQIIATPQSLDFGSPGGAASPTPSQWSAAGQKRHLDGIEPLETGKRRKEKGGKGLRHFSMKVCEKVQRKGVTTYNEVADELVAEFADNSPGSAQEQYDQKNIRRRVYDALNVLMAMNIISKERKEIRWIGLPANSAQECHNLEFEKRLRLERVKHKTQQLQELILQQIAFKNLVERNRELERRQGGGPSPNSAIQLPFIIVNTSKKTVIDCSISNDKFEYLFNFDNTFEIHDDIEVLKRMGMAFGLENNSCTPTDIQKAAKMVPKALEPYVLEMSRASGKMSQPEMGRASGRSGLGGRSLLASSMSSSTSTNSALSQPALSPDNNSSSLLGLDDEVSAVLGRRSAGLASSSMNESDEDENSSDRSSPIDI